MQQSYQQLDKHQLAWYNRVGCHFERYLNELSVAKDTVLMEVAPGFTTKVAEVLSKYGFEGTLIIVEPERDALAYVMEQYARYLPHAHLIPVCAPLGQLPVNQLPVVNTLLSNHPLDDFLLRELSDPNQYTTYRQYYNTDQAANITQELWQRLISDARLKLKMRQVVKTWLTVIVETQNTIINAYLSEFALLHNKTYPDILAGDQLAQQMLAKIKQSLSRQSVLHADNTCWLVYQKSESQ